VLGGRVKKCNLQASKRVHKGGRSATGDISSAAQARGISDKLKHGGRSDAGRTEKAREDDVELTNKGENNDRMFEGREQ
jgi:hypothetical protein